MHRVIYFHNNGTNANELLWAYHHMDKWHHVNSVDLTALLRQAATELPHLNVNPKEISAQSLRVMGAMALMCSDFDSNHICMMSHWQSDAM